MSTKQSMGRSCSPHSRTHYSNAHASTQSLYTLTCICNKHIQCSPECTRTDQQACPDTQAWTYLAAHSHTHMPTHVHKYCSCAQMHTRICRPVLELSSRGLENRGALLDLDEDGSHSTVSAGEQKGCHRPSLCLTVYGTCTQPWAFYLPPWVPFSLASASVSCQGPRCHDLPVGRGNPRPLHLSAGTGLLLGACCILLQSTSARVGSKSTFLWW